MHIKLENSIIQFGIKSFYSSSGKQKIFFIFNLLNK